MRHTNKSRMEDRGWQPRRVLSSAIFYVLTSFLILAPAGCNLLGAAADKTLGADSSVDAQYKPGSVPMVVIAENWQNPAGSNVDAEQLAEYVYHDLKEHDVGDQIDPATIADLRSEHPDTFHNLSIAKIGKMVGAHEVLYINVTQTSLLGAQASDTFSGKCAVKVKVVDVDSGQSVWPPDSAEGFPVFVQTPAAQATNDSDELALKQKLQQRAAHKIAKLFFKSSEDEDEDEDHLTKDSPVMN